MGAIDGKPAGLLDLDGDRINPATEETLLSVLSALGGGDYTIEVEEDSSDSNIMYVGKAAIGSATSSPVWQLFYIDLRTSVVATNVATKKWADGDANFDNIYDDRESKTYT